MRDAHVGAHDEGHDAEPTTALENGSVAIMTAPLPHWVLGGRFGCLSTIGGW